MKPTTDTKKPMTASQILLNLQQEVFEIKGKQYGDRYTKSRQKAKTELEKTIDSVRGTYPDGPYQWAIDAVLEALGLSGTAGEGKEE